MAAFGMSTEEVLQLATAWAQLEIAATALDNAYQTLGKMKPKDLPVRTVKQRMRKVKALSWQIVELGEATEVDESEWAATEASHGDEIVSKHGEESEVAPPTTGEEETKAQDTTSVLGPVNIVTAPWSSPSAPPIPRQAVEELLRKDPSIMDRIRQLNMNTDEVDAAAVLIEMRDGVAHPLQVGRLKGRMETGAEFEFVSKKVEVSICSPYYNAISDLLKHGEAGSSEMATESEKKGKKASKK